MPYCHGKHRLSAKQNKPNSTDLENNLGAGAVNVWGGRTFALNAVSFDAYVCMNNYLNRGIYNLIYKIVC